MKQLLGDSCFSFLPQFHCPPPHPSPKTCCQNEWEPSERSRGVRMANHVARPVEEGPGHMGQWGKVGKRDNR